MFTLTFRLALTSFRRHWVSRVVSIISTAAVLAVTGVMLQVTGGFSSVLDDIRSARWMTAYLSPSVLENQEVNVLSGVQKISGVENAQLVSKDAFIDNFQKYFPSLAKGLGELDADSIPRYIKIRVNANSLDGVRRQISANKGIEQIEVNEARFASLVKVITALRNFSLVLLIGVACAGASLVAYRSRSRGKFQEQVSRALTDLGAGTLPRALPGIMEGAMEGLCAGALAAAMLAYGAHAINRNLGHLFGAMGYESFPAPAYSFAALILGIGVFSGMIGSTWAQLRAKS